MRVAVWGAGEVGTALAYRLVTSPHVSELHWINRNTRRIESRVVDIEHGLAFAPTCHRAVPYTQDDADYALACADLVVLTQGGAVKPGGDRAELWPANRAIFRDTAIPRLSSNAIVLVVSNPVDALTSLVHDEASVENADARVIGLGTTVETARLRASLADTLLAPARELPVFAVGTHDGDFVPVWSSLGGLRVSEAILESAKREVVEAAGRIRRQEIDMISPCETCNEPRPRST